MSEADINELVLDKNGENLTKCGDHCSECKKGYYRDFPKFPIYQCVDAAHYMYGNKCTPQDDKSKCATG